MNAYELAECRRLLQDYGLDAWTIGPDAFGYCVRDEHDAAQIYMILAMDRQVWVGASHHAWINQKLRPTIAKALAAILYAMSCYGVLAKPKEAQQ